YVPGGYHPVHLEDTFNDRYLVRHKLGFGSFSTVWLASDLRNGGRLCALKIMTADCPDGEAEFLRRLCSHQPSQFEWPGTTTIHSSHMQPRSSFFPTLLDVFTINGPNGKHQCIVTESLGPSPSLSMLMEFYDWAGKQVPLRLVRKIGLGLVQAVAELHADGIIHGDLHPGNIALRAPGMGAWTADDVHKYLGIPHKVTLQKAGHPGVPLRSNSNPPSYLVLLPPLSAFLDLCYTSVTIYDSPTCSEESLIERVAMFPPPMYASPEVQLQDRVNITKPSDVWSIGCVLFVMCAGTYLFWDFTGRRNTLADLTICYGALPPEWWKRWTSRAEYFEEDGQ
ncbi:kinase-like domain-containing protein, partial [Kalaharituber pfeilii]